MHSDRSATPSQRKYIIVSPVKDEEKYISATLDSVIAQTVRPECWVIVDDGSTDGTAALVKRYCDKHAWIRLIQHKRGHRRDTGSAEALAFSVGYDSLKALDFDFVVKLDGDVRLEESYFERLLNRFEEDPSLGIASGIYLERTGKAWQPVKMPEYHASGATKVVRRKCFEEIGGFLTRPGWDTVDEIKARYRGWRTCHFTDAKFYHLRHEGTAMGRLHTYSMYGEISYLVGGSKLFFLLKLIHRSLFGIPPILCGIVMLVGYLRPALRRETMLISGAEARLYRQMLNKRILRPLSSVTPHPKYSLK
jgi:poly-beta-1,6-N-acetyl-D-glucosamine synthase